MRRPVATVIFICGVVPGCTAMQLERNTQNQFRTVSALYQQQVLDNLAMFVHEPGSLPYFNVLSTGLNQLVDQATAADTLSMARVLVGVKSLFMVSSNATAPTLQRTAQQNWTANPVTDPRRLELMRCAYQKELSHISTACPNCKVRMDQFYGVDSDKPDPFGRVTIACLGNDTPWFACGRKCDVPKSCDCSLVGHYCGTYVWVLPGGRSELSRLTLAILDYATNQPSIVTKTIVYNINRLGEPIAVDSNNKGVGTVTVTVPYNVSNKTVLDSATDAKKMHTMMATGVESGAVDPSELVHPPAVFQNTQPPDFQFLNQRLQQLAPPR